MTSLTTGHLEYAGLGGNGVKYIKSKHPKLVDIVI